jgi:putative phosphoesterase
MRLAVISDVHGNLPALEAVMADIARRSPDAIVNLGDCVTSPLWPSETLEELESLRWPTVRGNHDRWITDVATSPKSASISFARDALTERQKKMLRDLPTTLRVNDYVLAVHGTVLSDTEYLLEDKVDSRLALSTADVLQQRLGNVQAELVLCGHSHHQHFAADRRGRLVLNPGSVGCPRYADNEDRLVNEAGTPHARYAIATRRASGWSIELVALEYDWSKVVAQAELNGRPDWAQGFIGGG